MGFLTLLVWLPTTMVLALLTKPGSWYETALRWFLVAFGSVIVGSYILSVWNALNRVEAWLIYSVVLAVVCALILWRRPVKWSQVRQDLVPHPSHLVQELSSAPYLTRGIVLLLLVTLALTTALNLFEVAFIAPHNWDSLAYHLPQVAFFLQNGNTHLFPADYWAQVILPSGSAALKIFVFLVTGRNENWMQVVQFVSYLACVCAVYALTRSAGGRRTTALIAAGALGLVTIVLMEATTTQNDLILTAFIGCALAALFEFKRTANRVQLLVCGIALGLAAASKNTILLSAPALLLAVLYVMGSGTATFRKKIETLGWLAVAVAGAFVVLALPSGYFENYQLFGNVLGPAEIRQLQTISPTDTRNFITEGIRNSLRLAFDFVSLDGMPPSSSMVNAQTAARVPFVNLARAANLNLEDTSQMRTPFSFVRPPRADENYSFWGVLGLGLLVPLVFLNAVGVVGNGATRVLAWMVIVSWLVIAFAIRYEPWHGRRFVTAALFAAPLLLSIEPYLFAPHRRANLIRVFILGVIVVGCFSSISAIVFRHTGALSPKYESSILEVIRMEQLTAERPPMLEPLENFDRLVPADAVVATDLPENSYEYPLFGESLTRTILPIDLYWYGRQPIPTNADFLVYAGTTPNAQVGDIELGAGWYLRKLR